jgi:ATP-binding cassette subfamily B (MDR/TAP) protein 1
MRFLDKDVNHNDIINAYIGANCHSFILQLPNGYDTVIGDHGSMLPSGQKQYIAITSALIQDPAVLLLYEVTSTLDRESQKVI